MKNVVEIASAILATVVMGACHVAGDASSCRGALVVASQADLDALRHCDAIDGDLVIAGSDLVRIEGMERLHSVHNLVVGGNARLESLEGLSSLTSAQGVSVYGNPKLESLAGLSGIRTLEGLVVMNDGAGSLTGLALENAKEVTVVENPRITTLAALDLTQIETRDVERNGIVLSCAK